MPSNRDYYYGQTYFNERHFARRRSQQNYGGVEKGLKPESRSNLLTNISHRDSFGSSNWNNFVRMQNINKSTPNEQHRKLPLMKNSSYNRSELKSLLPENNNQSDKLTKIVGMDCEMVGVGDRGSISVLARVSLVNSYGECIYDKFVKPPARVTDYRTFVSGIRPHHLVDAENFYVVQDEVAKILRNRILVGHALKHDLEVLDLRHPRNLIRDTSLFLKFRREAKGTLSLKNLTREFLNVRIQDGEHDSVEDARAAMQLYMTFRKELERERRDKFVSSIPTHSNSNQNYNDLEFI